MSLKYNSFVAAAAIALSGAAIAQTTPSTTTTTTQPTNPDEAVPGHSATAPGKMQTTPGQTQAVPGEASQATPAVTGQTPAAQVTQATAGDVKKGVSVYDSKGDLVGKIDSVSAKGAVLNTGSTRAVIPVSSFGKGEKGLVVSMTKAEIDAAGKKSSPK